MVYPGATHRHFEHSLGVTELAGRVFDVITHPENFHFGSITAILPDRADMPYWRRVLRAAALCHDIGHGLCAALELRGRWPKKQLLP